MEISEKSNKKGLNILDLPEGCLSHILSLTSPLYILRCSLVCKLFYSLSKSNLVWDQFLPSDLDQNFIRRSFSFSDKKHLVLYLCRSFILLQEGTKSVSLDKWTGKKCYMLGARELAIYGSDYPNCWKWNRLTDARFPEVAELLGVSHLQITGKIRTQLLSPNTTYHAYFCFKLRSWSRGFDVCPVKVSVSMIDPKGAYLAGSSSNITRTFYLKAQEFDTSRLDILDDEETFVSGRDNDERWVKIDMGKYFNSSDNNVALLEMMLTGPDLGFIKSGLIVHGIELLPLC
ncbi:putative F-box protein PP2-B12 [Silene latifolia]|uniref:putative F-box protein PP2-B12 n=1 Tax=Silene latifolia TaxID=37657 RepID=UPI003D7856EE